MYLRKGETFAEIAAGFEVGTAAAWRYVNETVALLAARDAARGGYAYVVVDGALIAIDRVAADRPFYSGKHRGHGMNLQVIANPSGRLLWVSGALPGSVHDKAQRTRKSRTRAGTNRDPRKTPTRHTRLYTFCRSARQTQDEKGSLH